jgi:hypothetical protein
LPGLGGTSLLNANVFLEADPRTLSQNVFPPEIRENPSNLKHCIITATVKLTWLDYNLARAVLQPESYPEDFPSLPKLEVLEKQAKLLGPEFEMRFYRVPQTTTFKDGYNSMGVYQKESTLSGQDSTGLNDYSKNSTLMNYLPDAWNHGAEMYLSSYQLLTSPVSADARSDILNLANEGTTSGPSILHGTATIEERSRMR